MARAASSLWKGVASTLTNPFIFTHPKFSEFKVAYFIPPAVLSDFKQSYHNHPPFKDVSRL